MILVIVGESASGKTTLARKIEIENESFSRIITYTTRPPRKGEFDTIDYHFVTDEVFNNMVKQGSFVEHANYRGWQYGTAVNFGKDKNKIVVLSPAGARAFKKYIFKHPELELDICIVYLKVDRRSRLIKLLERGDNIEEAYHRSLSDVGQFDGFDKEADVVIYNKNYSKSIDKMYNEFAKTYNTFAKIYDEKQIMKL